MLRLDFVSGGLQKAEIAQSGCGGVGVVGVVIGVVGVVEGDGWKMALKMRRGRRGCCGFDIVGGRHRFHFSGWDSYYRVNNLKWGKVKANYA